MVCLGMNRDHSVIFEIVSKYCISDSFVDYDGYSISSKGFLPTVVDIMVIHSSLGSCSGTQAWVGAMMHKHGQEEPLHVRGQGQQPEGAFNV